MDTKKKRVLIVDDVSRPCWSFERGILMKENKVMVLVVDDDRRMVRTICDILAVNGYESREAYSGEEAVDKVSDYRFDCALMDIRMPGCGGISALQMIKGKAPDLPVIIMSAYATEEQVREAKKNGAYAVLDKPFNIQMVLSFLSLLRREESILIVDDDPAFFETIRNILQTRGSSVEAEADPEKALKLMEENYRLVVILNVKLGTASGLDVLKAIRTKYPTKPVLLVTGQEAGAAEALKQGRRIGAYSCFYKKFEAETLIKTIAEIRHKKLRVVLGEPFEQ